MNGKTDQALPTQQSPRANGAIGEFKAEFPDLDLVHEIEVFGAHGWQALARICDCLALPDSELVSFHARRYGDKGDVMTCRVRGADDQHLDEAVERIRCLAGVTRVSVTHHLGPTRRH
jgi:hypothetical protein